MLYAFPSVMVWMEMIRLRTTQAHFDNVADLLLDTVRRAAGESGLVRIHKYNSASYQTDMASSLVWDTTSFLHEGGRAGLSTSETLNTFGLVEHSIWVESTSVQDNFRRAIPNR
jgi:hypothetical protein